MKPARKPRRSYYSPFVVPPFLVPPGISAVYMQMIGGGGGGGAGGNVGGVWGGGGGGGAGGSGNGIFSCSPGSVQISTPGPPTVPYPDEMRCYLALLDVRNSRVWRKLSKEIRTNITRTLKGG